MRKAAARSEEQAAASVSSWYTLGMTPLVLRRFGLCLLLLAFAFYSYHIAPSHDPPGAAFWNLAQGHGLARNPAIFAVFNLLGVVPLMYWALMLPDGRGQKIWAWPFALGMMALGSFALLPYLILRTPGARLIGTPPNLVLRWFGGRPFAWCVDAALVVLLLWGIMRGDWTDYIRWFRTSNLVNVMSVDLLLLALLFPALLPDDFARRGVSDESPLARFALAVPLLGPAVYLALRPDENPAQVTKRAGRRS